MDLKPLLEISSHDHKHICPRQILGVRIGLKGMAVLGFEASLRHKHLLVISETDGCFIAFVNTETGRAVRVAPALDVRERASSYVPEEKRHYFAQMLAYQVMPDEELMTVQEVVLNISIDEVISHSGVRVNCARCGEEIMNERQVTIEGKHYCQSCAKGGYYQLEEKKLDPSGQIVRHS